MRGLSLKEIILKMLILWPLIAPFRDWVLSNYIGRKMTIILIKQRIQLLNTCNGTKIGKSILKNCSVASINGGYIDLGSM